MLCECIEFTAKVSEILVDRKILVLSTIVNIIKSVHSVLYFVTPSQKVLCENVDFNYQAIKTFVA